MMLMSYSWATFLVGYELLLAEIAKHGREAARIPRNPMSVNAKQAFI
jgi:hypothetical protein